jgi:hypothetical protein
VHDPAQNPLSYLIVAQRGLPAKRRIGDWSLVGDWLVGGDAGEAKAGMAKGEGDLLSQGGVCGGLTHDGEGAVDRLALRPLDGWADLRPMAAARQVCHPALETAVEQQPPVLVR